MTQKPELRAEVYERALRASQIVKRIVFLVMADIAISLFYEGHGDNLFPSRNLKV